MSIIFDFKAIRQDAAAIGIRTIGEDDLPRTASEPQQDCGLPSTNSILSNVPPTAPDVPPPAGAPIKSRDFFRGRPAVPGSAGNASVSGGMTAQQAASAQQYRLRNVPPPDILAELTIAPVTIADLLQLSDKDFARLLSRIDTGKLARLLDPDEEEEVDVDDEDDDAPEDDEDDDI